MSRLREQRVNYRVRRRKEGGAWAFLLFVCLVVWWALSGPLLPFSVVCERTNKDATSSLKVLNTYTVEGNRFIQ